MTASGALTPLLAAAVIAAGILPGCARWRERRAAREAAQQRQPEPQRLGLEVRAVPVRDTASAVGRALAPYESRPVPAEPVLLHRWRQAGLRVVAVPAADVDAVLAGLAPAGIAESNLWAQMPRWQALAAGAWGAGGVVATGAGVVDLSSGRARLLARAWVEPVLAAGGFEQAMRLELVPQIEGPRGRGGLADLSAPASPGGAGDEGDVLADLALSLTGRGDWAYVIVGEDPALDWADLPAAPAPRVGIPPAAAGPVPGGPEAGPGAPAGRSAAPPPTAGPVPARLRTLGEALLSDPGTVLTEAPGAEGVAVRPAVKLLIVLRPHLPEPGATS